MDVERAVVSDLHDGVSVDGALVVLDHSPGHVDPPERLADVLTGAALVVVALPTEQVCAVRPYLDDAAIREDLASFLLAHFLTVATFCCLKPDGRFRHGVLR